MHEWYSQCREFCDKYENHKEVRSAIHEFFRELSRIRIKEKGKFRQREGPEYNKFIESLKSKPEIIQDIVRDDDFFKLTFDKCN